MGYDTRVCLHLSTHTYIPRHRHGIGIAMGSLDIAMGSLGIAMGSLDIAMVSLGIALAHISIFGRFA